jgi:hypothetical protein
MTSRANVVMARTLDPLTVSRKILSPKSERRRAVSGALASARPRSACL